MLRRMMAVVMVAMIAMMLATPAVAQEEGQVLSQEERAAKQEKDLLIANINAMRNQEVRVAILQQLLNEEVAKLRQTQAVFCDQYKLDPDKWRVGAYRYDEESGNFVEKE